MLYHITAQNSSNTISTPNSHNKISDHKMLSKGWVAQKPLLIGSGERFAKGSFPAGSNLKIGSGSTQPQTGHCYKYIMKQLAKIMVSFM